MKSSKQSLQLGFKKKHKTHKQNISQTINRMITKQNITTLHNTTQTDYLLSRSSVQKHKKQKSFVKNKDIDSHRNTNKQNSRCKPPLRNRFQSFEEMSVRMNSRSLINNISHRSRSKSKIDEKLDEMLINQKVKEGLANQSKSKELGKRTEKEERDKNKCKLNLNKSIRQTTLSKYISELTEEDRSEKKKERGEQYIMSELTSIIGLVDGIFGVSKSEKLVNSYREQTCVSIPSLIATIKMKLESATKDSNIKKIQPKHFP